ncbi:MAG: ribonuclease HII [Eubacteriales bacterium]|nr:ribonuclease HII [Eubacteriales bacterium]
MARISEAELFAKLNQFELKALSQGYLTIAGIDEAGRGPLAGPVAAAAVILNPHIPILGLNDSKKLSEVKREILFEQIVKEALAFSVILIDAPTIDQINILEATKSAMREAISHLQITPDLLLIDAVKLDKQPIPFWPIIKGDTLSNSIAAASILAKVSRDRLMINYDRQFPGYGFAKHKGYGTTAHYESIHKLGITPIHRKTFLKNIL